MDIQYKRYVIATNKTCYIYPYVTYYQQYVFRKEFRLLPAGQAEEYVLSLPDFHDERNPYYQPKDEFVFFCQEFHVKKWVEEQDVQYKSGNSRTAFVVVIASGRAIRVEILRKDELLVGETGDEKKPINYQQELMKRLLRFRSPFFRLWYHNNNVCLVFGEPFTAEVLDFLFDFSHGGLGLLHSHEVLKMYFDFYLCFQRPDVIRRNLDCIFENCSIDNKTVWSTFIVTELVNRNECSVSQQKQEGIHTILDYCKPYIGSLLDDRTAVSPAQNTLNSECAFFNLGCSLDVLNQEFDVLVSEGYLPSDTDRNDFLFYFGGSEESRIAGKPLAPPKNKLKWIGNSTKIFALFLDSLGVDETWKTADEVFESVNTDSLKVSVSKYKKQKRMRRIEDADIIRSTEEELSRIIFQ